MNNRDVSRLLTDHYDRLIYPPKPPSDIARKVIPKLLARIKVTTQLQGKEKPKAQP